MDLSGIKQRDLSGLTERKDIRALKTYLEVTNKLLEIILPVVGINTCRHVLNKRATGLHVLKYCEITDEGILKFEKLRDYLAQTDEETSLIILLGAFSAFKSDLADIYGSLSSPELATVAVIKASSEVANAQREYAENIIKSIIDTLIVVTPEAEIRTVNAATCELLGYEEDELIGKSLMDIFEKGEKLFKNVGMEKVIAEGLIRDYEMVYRTKTGENIPVSFSGSVMRDENGNIIGVVGVGRDMREIKRLMEKEKEFAVVEAEAKLSREKAGELEKAYSELKKTQAQLIQAGKMAAVGQLAGGVAHEINNPMAVILGFAQILHSQIEQDSPLRMPVEQIEKEATRCKNLIQDLLVFSRTAKKTEEEVKLNEIAEEAVRLAEYQTKLGDIKIIKNLEQDVTLFGDKNGMQQVVINLIVNAKDAITDGGEIKVKTWEEGEKAFLSVQDTGVGIPEENLERIFEPFFTTKEVGKGTGLGLSLIYEIIQRHSGDIQVNSEVGKGTTFTISLPSGTKGRKTRQKPGINY